MGRAKHIIALALVATAVLVAGCAAASVTPKAQPKETTRGSKAMFSLTSPAFSEGADIPERFASRSVRGGANTSIPFSWTGTPTGTRSLALSVVDVAPVAHSWVHWLVIDIPVRVVSLAEGASGSSAIPEGARELGNTFEFAGYGGPQPPPGTGRHPYRATAYALDVAALSLPDNASLGEFERAVGGHVLGEASLTGYFGR